MFSPYAAMGNSPGMMIDPNGEMFEQATKRDANGQSGEEFTNVMESSLASGASQNGKVGLLRLLGMNSGGGGGRIARALGRGAIELFGSLVSLFDRSENQNTSGYDVNSINPIETVVEGAEPSDGGGEQQANVTKSSTGGIFVDYIDPYDNEEASLRHWGRKAKKAVGENKIIVMGHSNGLRIFDKSSGVKVEQNAEGMKIALNKIPEFSKMVKTKTPATIFLIGCNTAEIARQLSKMYPYFTVVGSDGTVRPVLINNKTDVELNRIEKVKNSGKNDGTWNFYKNGAVIKQPGNYFNNLNRFK